jgi:hypothetical protein
MPSASLEVLVSRNIGRFDISDSATRIPNLSELHERHRNIVVDDADLTSTAEKEELRRCGSIGARGA